MQQIIFFLTGKETSQLFIDRLVSILYGFTKRPVKKPINFILSIRNRPGIMQNEPITELNSRWRPHFSFLAGAYAAMRWF
jgi:hypothetical protein